MPSQAPVVNVLYGTVTGNAEEIARNIHSLLPKKRLQQGLLRCLADYAEIPAFMKPAECSENTYNVIVVSTTGDGDPPDTIRPFMKLMRSKEKGRLTGLNFTVLALGDTNYENFCKTGKRVDTSLAKLGANRFFARGDADDGIGLEIVVEPWLKRLWGAFEEIFPSSSDDEQSVEGDEKTTIKEPEPSDAITTAVVDVVKLVTAQSLGFDESKLPPIPSPKLGVQKLTEKAPENTDLQPLSVHPSYSPSVSHVASLSNARLLTASDAEKTVWHVELKCDGSGSQSEPMSYRPGDAFGLVAENDPSEVARFLKLTNSNPDEMLRITAQNGSVIVEASVERIVRERLDLRTIPSKTLLRVLSESTEKEAERRLLLEFSSRGGRLEYNRRISGKNATVLDVLETIAPSCKAPLDVYIDLLPAIPLRWYSATSSPVLDGENVVHFAFSVVENGLATNAMARRCEAFLAGENPSPVILSARDSDATSHFHPPESLQTSYIMIGPGTGVAPFRGFLRERKCLKGLEDSELGKTMLFFGCTHKDKDYLYQDDLEQLVEDGILSELSLAFSRDQDHKIYVQDRLLELAEPVADVIRGGGSVFVCGDGGGMAMGVNNALIDIVTKHLCDGDIDAGKKMMKQLTSEHRYVREIWHFG